MRLLCPAKINLHLRVGPRRADGFHSLLSWFCTVGLFDTLTLELCDPSASSPADPPIVLSCDDADLPRDERNLVVKVAMAWANEARRIPGSSVRPAYADLTKRIPHGAGLGGGSSDGASALQAVDALWKTHQPMQNLAAFAARHGSDLPFFFHGPSSICTGRGEIVRPILRPEPRWALLILPPIMMPTADVYRRFDAMNLGWTDDIEHEPDWLQWTALDARSLLEKLVNDLEAPAFAISPELAKIRADVEALVDRPVRMSGSGSSLFTLFDYEAEAHRTAQLLVAKRIGRIEVVALGPENLNGLATEVAKVV